MNRYWLNILTALLLSGCIGQKSSPSKYYLLTGLTPDTPTLLTDSSSAPMVTVEKVEIPAFLDRPQMVLSYGSNQLQFAEFDRWAEPIETGFTRVLRENLARLLGSEQVSAHPWGRHFAADFTVTTVIIDLKADPDAKTVKLTALWKIAGPDGKYQFETREKLYREKITGSKSDYSAIALAISRTIAALSADIAQNLLQLNGQTPKTQ